MLNKKFAAGPPGRGQRWLLTIAWLMTLALTGLVSMPAAAVTLRWAAQNDVLTLDPHAQNHTPTSAILQHAYEGLTRMDRHNQVEPALATSWTMITPTEWRFQIRKGVLFHEGTQLTADDVTFSFERLRDTGNSLSSLLNGIKDVRKIDEFTVDLILERPIPLLLRNLIDVRIISRNWAQKNKSEKAQDLKTREETYASRNANGTGPYRITSWAPDQRIVMNRNPSWWDSISGNVDEVIFTPIRQDATRIAALQSGDVDLVSDPPTAEVVRLRQSPELSVLDGPEARTVFIGMDQFSNELRYSPLRGRNPFKDIRVRRAMSLAIDAPAIRQKVMNRMSIPAAILVAPGVTGWNAQLDKRPAVDLREARSLLTEAGYPEGFEVTLDCPTNRYAYDEEICRALVGMWAKINVKVTLNAMPFANLIPKLDKLDSSLWFLGWGANNLDGLQTLQALVHTRNNGEGNYNIGRISNVAIDAMIDAARSESDLGQRESMIRDALQLTAQNYYYLPIHHQMRAWVMKKNVTTVYKEDDRPESRYAVVK